jgi:hypothetical protein
MVSKKITLSIFLIATIGGNNHITALSDNAYAECYKGKDSEYRYLEFYFIEQPKNLLNASLQKARATILATVATIILANTQLKYFDPKTNSTVQYFKPDINLNTIAASVLGLTGFDLYSSYKEAEIKQDILVKFIANFDLHKQYIPACLIPAFEELAAAFNASATKTFLANDVNAIFEVIQHLIEHEFSKRYEKEKKKDEGTLGLFKTITDISKNLK